MPTRRRVISRLIATLAAALLGVALAGAALAAAGGPNLGVQILRIDDDSRLLVAPGQAMTLAVGVNNLRGDRTAPDVKLTVVMPDGFTLAAGRPKPDRASGRTFEWTMGALPAGAFPRFIEIEIRASDALRPGTAHELSATVATSSAEADQANNRDVLPIRIVPTGADVSVGSNLDQVDLLDDRPTVATLSVVNLGTNAAASCLLTFTMPQGMSLAAAEPAPASQVGRSATWRLGDLAPSGGVTIQVTLAPDPILAAGLSAPLSFALDATSATADSKPANNRLEVIRTVVSPLADLKVWLSFEPPEGEGAPQPGSVLTGRITYGNFGRVAAEAVTLSLKLDDGMAYLGAGRGGAGQGVKEQASGGSHVWRIGRLPAGVAGMVDFRVRVENVAADGGLATAELSSPTPESNTADNAVVWLLPESLR